MELKLLFICLTHQSGSKLVSSAKDIIISDRVHSRMCSDQRVRENRTQVVVEKVEEHQHAAAHDYENTDHDGGDVNRLFVLLLCRLVPLQLKVAPGGKQTPSGALTRGHCWMFAIPEPSGGPGGLFPLSLNSISSHDLASCQSGRGDHTAVHQRYLPSAAQLAGHNSFLATLQNTQSVLRNIFRLRPCATQLPSDCALALALHQGGWTWTE